MNKKNSKNWKNEIYHMSVLPAPGFGNVLILNTKLKIQILTHFVFTKNNILKVEFLGTMLNPETRYFNAPPYLGFSQMFQLKDGEICIYKYNISSKQEDQTQIYHTYDEDFNLEYF